MLNVECVEGGMYFRYTTYLMAAFWSLRILI